MVEIDWEEVPGYLATSASFFLFLPQIRLAWRGKGHVAWGTAAISLVISASWIVYGILHNLPTLIAANAFLLILMLLIVLLQKIRGGSENDQ